MGAPTRMRSVHAFRVEFGFSLVRWLASTLYAVAIGFFLLQYGTICA